MLPPSARGRTLCGFGIVLLLAPVLFPPPTHPAARRAGLLALPPSGDAATGGCFTTAGLRALFVLSYTSLSMLACMPPTQR